MMSVLFTEISTLQRLQSTVASCFESMSKHINAITVIRIYTQFILVLSCCVPISSHYYTDRQTCFKLQQAKLCFTHKSRLSLAGFLSKWLIQRAKSTDLSGTFNVKTTLNKSIQVLFICQSSFVFVTNNKTDWSASYFVRKQEQCIWTFI